jgi:hypothetical protein
VWIDKISGFPDAGKERGFLTSTASWGIKNITRVTVAEISALPPRYLERSPDQFLFVSIDLDFFYNEDYTPQDIPFVFNRILDYTLDWKGNAVWALCLSRAWLPSDEYAWALLEQSLMWLHSRTEFEKPELTLFTSYRYDTSRKAAAFRAEGMEPPGFFSREGDVPDYIKDLLSLPNPVPVKP